MYSAALTSRVVVLLALLLGGCNCFEGDPLFARFHAACLGLLLISLILQNLREMLHRELNQVRRLATENLHRESLQEVFETGWYLNITHPPGSAVGRRMLRFNQTSRKLTEIYECVCV